MGMAREGWHASVRYARTSSISRISITFNGAELAMASCDVYDVYVVRKQLYISDEHERALKARARELGVSEAALVRRMLDGLLLDGPVGSGLAGAGAAEALEGFLEEADRLAESHGFPEGYRFDRDELYEDRV
jgi:hypothetical protein